MYNIDMVFKVKFNNSNNLHIKPTFISTNNSQLKPQFTDSDSMYSNTHFNTSQNTFIPKAEVTPVEKDIYYDEVIYYDGGNVEGYGYDK